LDLNFEFLEKWTDWYSKYLNDKRVYGSCGIHPHWSSLWTETSAEDIERCLQHPKIVAIGEIGLDFGPK
jgi:Tat protein secretion system quality control protein TatD with DNase activity